MASFPIEWHENCLKNSSSYLARSRSELERMQAEIERDATAINVYSYQIEEAKKRGLTSFDKERFLKQKKRQNS